MKATIYMATYNKNDLLPNTLYSIARQKTSFPFELCIVDDCSDVDPEPIIRQFTPYAKYKRFNKRQGFDAVTTHVLDLASEDSEVIIMQSADVIHYGVDTIEKICRNVAEKTVCMASVSNTAPPVDMYKDFEGQLPQILKEWRKGVKRSYFKKKHYFFLGGMLIKDYKSMKCVSSPYCDLILKREMVSSGYKFIYPADVIGFHQHHSPIIVPCHQIDTCSNKCSHIPVWKGMGWNNFDDYLGGNCVI